MNSEMRKKESGSVALIAVIVIVLILAGAGVLLFRGGVFDFGGDNGESGVPPGETGEQFDDQSALSPTVGDEVQVESDNLGAEIFEETGGQVQGENLTPSVAPIVNPLRDVYKNPFE